MDENLEFDGAPEVPSESADTTGAENAALRRALERVKKDAEAELHAGHHTHHNSHASHNTCMII